ncbi:VCBS repeat-containing protein [Streptomyces sp. YC504]|uniref:VCBS repeat-containing protein n=1 Tax=Streptomyces mesophilus TaxID=1775132 RepID=A0A6G4XBT7_9ACTN|nr:VCBS repeat-containing protein [Streptomyces mesophilus]NGO74204.1 VCBS repeat-containing protein [Streptomyces mesophilus]
MSAVNHRGLRLATALVAAGLAITAAPPALAADDNGPLTLTEAQADRLSRHAQLDAYGDGASTDPLKSAAQAEEAAPADAASEATGATTDAAKWKLTERSALEGVQGMAATVPVTGTDGDYFALHSLGTVQRRSSDGKQAWMRDTASLYRDWKVSPLRVYQREPYPARIVMGFNAVSPFSATSDQGWDTGDLTGDGVADMVFTARVGDLPYRPFTSPGSSLPTGTFVTVLDGATGRTLWSKLYAGAFQVKLVDGTLIVADSAFYNLNSPADSKTTLHGIRFAYADGNLAPSQTWTHDAGTYTGVSWGSLEPLGDGLLAASWNQSRSYSPDKEASGHTLVVDTRDGSVKWSSSNRLYSRQLHWDSARGRLVALEQSDPADGVTYEITSYAPADGTRTVLDTRTNALPLAMTLGTIKGDSRPEYVVSESTLDTSARLSMNTNTVRALDGDRAEPLWSRTVKRDADSTSDVGAAWGLRIADGKVIASYVDDRGSTTADNRAATRYARLAVLAGNSGAVKWEQRGLVASQAFAQPYRQGEDWYLRTVDSNQNVHAYSIGSGKQHKPLPLQGQLFAAASTDINGDKKQDLVAGGTSDGLFAYDGPSLVDGTPKLLWTAVLPGQIHQVVKADTNGDGRDELIVAADSAAAVVDARTGKVLTTIDGMGQFVRNVAAADLDGDGRAEIVVATDKVRVYRGTGQLLWEYAAPAEVGDAVFADVSVSGGKVHAQYQTRGKSASSAVPVGGVALNGKDGSVAWSFVPEPGTGTDGKVYGVPLRAGTYASPGIPYADGHAVVYTYLTRRADGTVYNGQFATMIQIRDGRTGELLHEAMAGGFGTAWKWFTGPQGLVLAGNANFRTFAANGQDHIVYTYADIRSGAIAAGPDQRSVLVAGGVQTVDPFDPSLLTDGPNYPVPSGGAVIAGAQELFTGDLDGDGVDEVVSLNFDDYGTDRTYALVGGSYSQPFTAMRRLVTLTIDKP